MQSNSRYFILGQPGSSIHYIGCLIRLINDPDKFDSMEKTNAYGKYDGIFGSHAFKETLIDFDIDESNIDLALDKLNLTLSGQYELQRNYPVEQYIFPTHLAERHMLESILDKVPNSKIIFVTTAAADRLQVINNLLVKFYLNGLLTPEFFSAFNAFYAFWKYNKKLSILDKDKFTAINRSNHPYLLEVMDFISKFNSRQFELYSKLPLDHERVIEVKFDEVSKDSLIDKLEMITGMSANKSVHEFAEYFKTNQPNFSQIQSLIEQVKSSAWADIVYQYGIPNFKQSTTEAQRRELWQQCLKIYYNK